jgi:hypothetical protein
MSESYVKTLLEEVEVAEGSLFPPRHAAEEKEKVLGEATPYMQKLWSLAKLCERDAAQMRLDHKFSAEDHGEDQCRIEATKYAMLTNKQEILELLFWSCVRTEFNAWGGMQLGLRKGWKIVDTLEARQNAVQKFLEILRGESEE